MLSKEQKQRAKIIGAACRRLIGGNSAVCSTRQTENGDLEVMAYFDTRIGYKQTFHKNQLADLPVGDLAAAAQEDTAHMALCEIFQTAFGRENLPGPEDLADLIEIGLTAMQVPPPPRKTDERCKRCGTGRMLQLEPCPECGRDPFDDGVAH